MAQLLIPCLTFDLKSIKTLLTQALQRVTGSTYTEIKEHIDTQYVGVSKSFLRNPTDIKNALARLTSGGYIKVCFSSIVYPPQFA